MPRPIKIILVLNSSRLNRRNKAVNEKQAVFPHGCALGSIHLLETPEEPSPIRCPKDGNMRCVWKNHETEQGTAEVGGV
jgi:hypothetical protein